MQNVFQDLRCGVGVRLMRHGFAGFILILLFLSLGVKTVAGAGVDYVKIEAPSLGAGKVIEVGISVPPGNHFGKPLPLALFLHGWGGSARTWEGLDGPALLGALISSHQLPAMIVVAPDGGNSNWLNWQNGEQHWEDFLTKDLPAAMKKRFRITGFALFGTSMGGEAALRLALKFPARFQCVVALSAALHPADPDKLSGWAKQGFSEMPELKKQFGSPLDDAFWKANNVLSLASNLPKPSDAQLRIFFDVGIDDHLGFAPTNAELSSILSRRGIPHVFGLRPGGHGDKFYRANLESSLRVIGECFRDGKADEKGK